jgi:hypothetical protein
MAANTFREGGILASPAVSGVKDIYTILTILS